jgi:hypothetical protein
MVDDDEHQIYFAKYSLGKWSSGVKHLKNVETATTPNYPYNNVPGSTKWKGVTSDDD